MRQLESSIREDLISGDPFRVKDGLSSVLYWGYYRFGYRGKRVNNFRNKITEQGLALAAQTLQSLSGAGLQTLKELGLPQFSKVTFLSKVRMFLAPQHYVVLDKGLVEGLKNTEPVTLFQKVKVDTSIPVTPENELLYQRWCNLCEEAVKKYFQGQDFLAVDVERGIWHLVKNSQHKEAANIIVNIEEPK